MKYILFIIVFVLSSFIILCMIQYTKRIIQDKRLIQGKYIVYLINLDKSQDRLEMFKKYCKYPFTRVYAIDGEKMKDVKWFKEWPWYKTDENEYGITKGHYGTKGITLSYIKTLKIAKTDKCEWAIICEDDAKLFEIDWNSIVSRFNDSKVIYLDKRNKEGDGVIPGCCRICVMIHSSVFDTLINELHPLTSKLLKPYIDEGCTPLGDLFLAYVLKTKNIKTSSYPIVSSTGMISTIS
jgi:hypothetical protein